MDEKKVRAKFQCQCIEQVATGEKNILLTAVYEGDENKEWAAAPPGGVLSMTIGKDTAAKDFFKQGKIYNIDFTEV